MMWYIETDNKDAAFHFSVEEYVMRHFPHNEPVMMIWQTDPCAMLGSNQVAEAEIDLSSAEREGVQIVRRSSGGGTIFTDAGTLLLTVIVDYDEEQNVKQIARDTLAKPLVRSINTLGVPAKIEGRNDILVDGKKISGFAQSIRHGKICTHGSLLYDADLETLARVLKVDDEKIRSKALRSIRSRVTNVKGYMKAPCSTKAFWDLLKERLFEGHPITEYKLTEKDLAAIDCIYKEKYGNPAWTIGRAPRFSFHSEKRFPGGKVEVYLDIEKGVVTACTIRGDFLGVMPVRALEQRFEGSRFQRQAFINALEDVFLPSYLGSVTKDELLESIFG